MTETRSTAVLRYVALSSDRVIAQAFWILTFALATAVGAQVEIPHAPVPYTLQTFFVILAGGVLGRRNAFLSMTAYLGMGALGLPVFSGLSFGVARILGPSGGYLLAFPVAAYLIGTLIALRPVPTTTFSGRYMRLLAAYGWGAISMGSGLLVIFLLGTLQLNAVVFHDMSRSFAAGFLIFSWWDLLKLAAAVAIWKEVSRV